MAQPTENSAYSQRPGETVPKISEKDRANPSPLKVEHDCHSTRLVTVWGRSITNYYLNADA